MQPFGLKFLTIVAAIGATSGMAFATDSTVQTALERWQEDPSIVFEASEVDLAAFLWLARPVVIFADTPADPAFKRQIELLAARSDELIKRDVVLITDTNPNERSDVRTKLRPRGFMLTLIGKDGGVKLRKPFPWDVRELTRQIDKMPLRKQEILEARQSAE